MIARSEEIVEEIAVYEQSWHYLAVMNNETPHSVSLLLYGTNGFVLVP